MRAQIKKTNFTQSLSSSKSSGQNASDNYFPKLQNQSMEMVQFSKTYQKCQVIQKVTIQKLFLKEYIRICQWRASHKDKIVPINKIMIPKTQTTISTIELKIFRDSYPLRITDIQLISLPELIKLVESSVEGFRLLEQQFGTFTITEEMFAIGKSHKCKVWLNQHYCENKSSSKYQDWETNKCYLLNIFKNICLSTVLAQQFFQHLKKCSSFAQISQQIILFKKENKLNLKEGKNPVIKKIQANELKFTQKHKKGLLSSQNLAFSQRNFQFNKNCSYNLASLRLNNKESLTTNSSKDHSLLQLNSQKKNQHLIQISSIASSDSSISLGFNSSFKYPFSEEKKNNISLQTRVVDHVLSPFSDETEKTEEKQKIFRLESFCRVVDENEENDIDEFFTNPQIDISPRRKRRFQKDEDFERDRIQCEKIIKENGWSKKVLGLLNNEAEVQESLNYGETNYTVKRVQLQKLDSLGKQMTKSIVSNPQDEE